MNERKQLNFEIAKFKFNKKRKKHSIRTIKQKKLLKIKARTFKEKMASYLNRLKALIREVENFTMKT